MTGNTCGSLQRCCFVASGMRLIEKLLSRDTQPELAEAQFEDDTHADMCDMEKGCYIKNYLDRYCIVNPFMDSYEGQKVPTVNALYCYDNQDEKILHCLC